MRLLKRSATIPIVLLSLALAGCQGMGGRRSVAINEPPMDESLVARNGDVVGGGLVARATPAPPPTVTFVDRHPLFSRPRDFYENSGNNKAVKVGAATLIGIPAGVVGEIKQIVVGRPAALRPY